MLGWTVFSQYIEMFCLFCVGKLGQIRELFGWYLAEKEISTQKDRRKMFLILPVSTRFHSQLFWLPVFMKNRLICFNFRNIFSNILLIFLDFLVKNPHFLSLNWHKDEVYLTKRSWGSFEYSSTKNQEPV